MKRPKRLTREMKIALKRKGLNPLNWWYVKSTSEALVLVHKVSGKTRTVE